MLYVHLVGLVQENNFSNWSFKNKTRQINSYYKSLNKERGMQEKTVNCEVSQWKLKFWYFCVVEVFIQKMPDDGPYENRNMHLKTKI
jgi:hypothetical protein